MKSPAVNKSKVSQKKIPVASPAPPKKVAPPPPVKSEPKPLKGGKSVPPKTEKKEEEL